MTPLAPIVLFTYKRLETLKITIGALLANRLAAESDLIIYSDGPKNQEDEFIIQEIRKYLQTIKGFKSVSIHESKTNNGLATSIINGVSDVIAVYNKAIVLEDDLLSAPNFLNFMNSALDYFENNLKIYAINGYSHLIEGLDSMDDGVYFHSRASSWGWATWGNRWKKNIFDKNFIREKLDADISLINKFNKMNGADSGDLLLRSLNGKNDSWYIRWVFYNFLKNKLSVYPVLSKIENIGFNTEASNCYGIFTYISLFDTSNRIHFDLDNIVPLSTGDYRFLKYFSKKYKLIFRVKLLKTSIGRGKLVDELKLKLCL
jgi:hypothetical protein